jgi:hypothetical protein
MHTPKTATKPFNHVFDIGRCMGGSMVKRANGSEMGSGVNFLGSKREKKPISRRVAALL